VPAIRAAIVSLLRHSLSEDTLFQHDSDEVCLWLESLSVVQRNENTEAPDGARLGDEGIAITKFLDDCALRCAKTPYKYLEDLCSVVRATDVVTDIQSNPVAERPEAYPSPLLMTVMEQLSAKVSGKLLSASETLAVASYIRKLVFRLAGKVQDLQFLRNIVEKYDFVLPDDIFLPEYPSMNKGIRREVSILKAVMKNILYPEFEKICEPSAEMNEFLKRLECVLDGMSDNSPPSLLQFTRLIDPASLSSHGSACELIDWLRLVDHPLHLSEALRFVSIVRRFHNPTLRVLFRYFHPGRTLMWDVALDFSNFDEIRFA
jgi:nucleolar pre-ribosomal-associated protein 1